MRRVSRLVRSLRLAHIRKSERSPQRTGAAAGCTAQQGTTKARIRRPDFAYMQGPHYERGALRRHVPLPRLRYRRQGVTRGIRSRCPRSTSSRRSTRNGNDVRRSVRLSEVLTKLSRAFSEEEPANYDQYNT